MGKGARNRKRRILEGPLHRRAVATYREIPDKPFVPIAERRNRDLSPHDDGEAAGAPLPKKKRGATSQSPEF